MFIPLKMTVKLDHNDCIVELDFTNTDDFIVSSSVPLSVEERMTLSFKMGMFLGAGSKVLTNAFGDKENPWDDE